MAVTGQCGTALARAPHLAHPLLPASALPPANNYFLETLAKPLPEDHAVLVARASPVRPIRM